MQNLFVSTKSTTQRVLNCDNQAILFIFSMQREIKTDTITNEPRNSILNVISAKSSTNCSFCKDSHFKTYSIRLRIETDQSKIWMFPARRLSLSQQKYCLLPCLFISLFIIESGRGSGGGAPPARALRNTFNWQPLYSY